MINKKMVWAHILMTVLCIGYAILQYIFLFADIFQFLGFVNVNLNMEIAFFVFSNLMVDYATTMSSNNLSLAFLPLTWFIQIATDPDRSYIKKL